jgi:hypothetical protein
MLTRNRERGGAFIAADCVELDVVTHDQARSKTETRRLPVASKGRSASPYGRVC